MRTGDSDVYRRTVDQRLSTPPFSQRRIFVEADIGADLARFVIRDEGPGFDPDSIPDPTDPANVDKPGGRGMLLMRTFMDVVQYNEIGNEVILEKHAPAAALKSVTS